MTVAPRALSARQVYAPMKPAAPVTRMVPGEVSAIGVPRRWKSVGFGVEVETQGQFEVRQSRAQRRIQLEAEAAFARQPDRQAAAAAADVESVQGVTVHR